MLPNTFYFFKINKMSTQSKHSKSETRNMSLSNSRKKLFKIIINIINKTFDYQYQKHVNEIQGVRVQICRVNVSNLSKIMPNNNVILC